MRKIFTLLLTTAVLWLTALNVPAGVTETILASFTNTPDAAVPAGPLTLLRTNLYGVSLRGGAKDMGAVFICGTNPTIGNIKAVLTSLTNTDYTGRSPLGPSSPVGGVVTNLEYLYFVTMNGGSYDASYGRYFDGGTICVITNGGGTETVLQNFGVENWSGRAPADGVTMTLGGLLFGTTQRGGSPLSAGTLFYTTTGGAFKNVHNFGIPQGDGVWPMAALTEWTNGYVYGTTAYGGTYNKGTIYEVSTNGTGYNVIYSFGSNSLDGVYPMAPGFFWTNGVMYGVTAAGGTNGYGSIYTLSALGAQYTVATNYAYASIYSFAGGATDGAYPVGGLCQSSAKKIMWGEFARAGTNGAGGLYMITATNGYQVAYAFTNTPDGSTPVGGLTPGPAGELYGVTQAGGSNQVGCVFKVVP